VRLRFLEPAHPPWVPGAEADYTVSQQTFARACASGKARLHHRERDQPSGLSADLH
jgi:hypothetical protein